MTVTKRRTAAEIIAFHRGYDLAEMAECRYQPTRYSAPAIYVLGDDYYAAPSNGKMADGYAGMNWSKVGQEYGRPVFRATLTEN